MKYQTGSAFRRALEDWILLQNKVSGVPFSRIRKLTSFDRFLARMVVAAPEAWVLKGGYFMELCFHLQSRTTKDIDLLFVEQKHSVYKILSAAAKLDLKDWFSFQVSQPFIEGQGRESTQRFQVAAFVDTRTFEEFHIDININDILLKEPQHISSPKYPASLGLSSTQIPCYSLTQQIAEKFHAMSRTYKIGGSSRVKDLADILLIAGNTTIQYSDLRNAIAQTFKHRHTHEIPRIVPLLSANYSRQFSKLAGEMNLSQKTLAEGNLAFEQFMSPILNGKTDRGWNPKSWSWT